MVKKINPADYNGDEKTQFLMEQYERFLCAFCRECAYMEDIKIRIEKEHLLRE